MRLLLAATVFWVGILAWHSNLLPPSAQEYQQPTVAPQQDSQAGTPVADDKQHGKRNQESKWYDKFLDHLPDWFVAMFTGLLVYVTYRLVKATSDLRISTDRLWEAGERQIAVAKQAADAALMSAKVAAGVERPFVYVKDPTITISEDGSVEAGLRLINLGRTPAIVHAASYKLRHRPEGLPLPNNRLRFYTQMGRFFLHEREETDPVSAHLPAPAEGVERPRKSNTFLLVHIYYADVFGNRRRAKYCYGWDRGALAQRSRTPYRVGGKEYNYERIERAAEAED